MLHTRECAGLRCLAKCEDFKWRKWLPAHRTNVLVCCWRVSEASDINAMISTAIVIEHISSQPSWRASFPELVNCSQIHNVSVSRMTTLWAGLLGFHFWWWGRDVPFYAKSRQALAYLASSTWAVHR